MDHSVAGEDRVRAIGCYPLQPCIERREGFVGFGEKLFEAVDDEVGLLIAVDPEFRREHTLKIESDPVRRRTVDRIDGLAMRRENPRTIGPQSLRRLNETELDGVPIEP